MKNELQKVNSNGVVPRYGMHVGRPFHESLGQRIRQRLLKNTEDGTKDLDNIVDTLIKVSKKSDHPHMVTAAKELLRRGWGEVPKVIETQNSKLELLMLLPDSIKQQLIPLMLQQNPQLNDMSIEVIENNEEI